MSLNVLEYGDDGDNSCQLNGIRDRKGERDSIVYSFLGSFTAQCISISFFVFPLWGSGD